MTACAPLRGRGAGNAAAGRDTPRPQSGANPGPQNVMKLGHNKRAALPLAESDKPPISRFREWQVGVAAFTLGNGGGGGGGSGGGGGGGGGGGACQAVVVVKTAACIDNCAAWTRP